MTIEQIINDLRRYAEQFDVAAATAPRAPQYAAGCRQVAMELRSIADNYERGELMTKEEA